MTTIERVNADPVLMKLGEPHRLTITHTATLPHGYQCEFRWQSPATISIEWTPAVPRLRSRRQARRFLRSYAVARSEFLELVAHTIGGTIAAIDLDGRELAEMSIVEPPTRQ